MPPYLNLLIFFALCHFSKLPACRVLDDLYSFVPNCCNMCFWFILKRALDITSWTGCNMAIGSPIFCYPYCFIYLSFFSWTNIFFCEPVHIFAKGLSVESTIIWLYKVSPSYDFSRIMESHLVTLFSSGNRYIISILPLTTSVLCPDASLCKSVIAFIIRLSASTN